MKTRRMVELRMVLCEVCVPVPRGKLVSQQTNSLEHLSHGASLTLATATTTGQDCTADWVGMDSSVLL